jgi:hypothetical protein
LRLIGDRAPNPANKRRRDYLVSGLRNLGLELPEQGAAMTQPTDLDLFDSILEAAYQELQKFTPQPETYEQYVKAEMLDHQYKEPRYRK